MSIKRYKSREDLSRELAEMRQKFLEIETCRLEIESAQQKYEQLLESAPDAMVFVSKEAKIVLCNSQLCSLFGYREDELIGRDLADIIPERYRERHYESVSSYFESPQIRLMGSDVMIYGLRKDGTEFPADVSLSPLVTEDGTVVVAAVRDITEQKKAEDEKHRLMEQVAQAEKLSALGRIAANVADEIRNPLTVVGGFARRLIKVADSEKEREYAKEIISEVGRLERILREVLAYSHTKKPVLKDRDLNAIVNDALKVFEERQARQSVKVIKSFLEEAIVHVDAEQVRDSIEHIVANALDAMPDGGTLTAETTRETLLSGHYIVVKISDTGRGIPSGIMDKILEPFFTTKVSPKGTGLGLPIAKKVVEEEGGIIKFDSIEGKGTTVSILFPDISVK